MSCGTIGRCRESYSTPAASMPPQPHGWGGFFVGGHGVGGRARCARRRRGAGGADRDHSIPDRAKGSPFCRARPPTWDRRCNSLPAHPSVPVAKAIETSTGLAGYLLFPHRSAHLFPGGATPPPPEHSLATPRWPSRHRTTEVANARVCKESGAGITSGMQAPEYTGRSFPRSEFECASASDGGIVGSLRNVRVLL